MSKSITNYANAVAAGDTKNITTTLSPSVKLMAPATNLAAEGIDKAVMSLSVVAVAVAGFKFIRSYSGEDDWHTILFEGMVDETPVQFIDQVHIDENGLINHIDIFLRPASVAAVLGNKITMEIQKRTSNEQK